MSICDNKTKIAFDKNEQRNNASCNQKSGMELKRMKILIVNRILIPGNTKQGNRWHHRTR